MIKRHLGAIEWLEFHLLQPFPDLKHAVFLRHGGASRSPFATLNSSYTVGDQSATVDHNLMIIAETLHPDHPPQLVWPEQIHGSSVKIVTAPTPQHIPGCDGLMTHQIGIGLLTRHADCQCCLFYDPKNRVIANVHAGWRGNVQNIYGNTVKELTSKFGTEPKRLIACIGPSLGPTAAEFVNYKTELPKQ